MKPAKSKRNRSAPRVKRNRSAPPPAAPEEAAPEVRYRVMHAFTTETGRYITASDAERIPRIIPDAREREEYVLAGYLSTAP